MTFRRALLLLALILCWTIATPLPLSGQLASRPAEEWIKTLDGETRVASLKIDEVVAAMHLQPGQTVADIGAGTGLLSVPVAKAVGPRGRVFAVEIDAGFFPAIKKRADDNGVANIQTVLGSFTDPKLPVTNVNLAFFHDVLHHVENRGEYLKTLARYVAPQGPDLRSGLRGRQGTARATTRAAGLAGATGDVDGGRRFHANRRCEAVSGQVRADVRAEVDLGRRISAMVLSIEYCVR